MVEARGDCLLIEAEAGKLPEPESQPEQYVACSVGEPSQLVSAPKLPLSSPVAEYRVTALHPESLGEQ
jgi:hypothetical protein